MIKKHICFNIYNNDYINQTNYTNLDKEVSYINITYINKKKEFSDVITYSTYYNKIANDDKSVTIVFSDVSLLNNYMSNNKITE